MKWQQNPEADGYVIYWGKSPDKMYGSIMVYGKTNISLPEQTEQMLIISRLKLSMPMECLKEQRL
jgi:hypothetical protein